jgi:hypothetical protein
MVRFHMLVMSGAMALHYGRCSLMVSNPMKSGQEHRYASDLV